MKFATKRAKPLLAMDAGAHNSQMARQMHLNRGPVCMWSHRWLALTPYGQNIGTHYFPDVYGLILDLASS